MDSRLKLSERGQDNNPPPHFLVRLIHTFMNRFRVLHSERSSHSTTRNFTHPCHGRPNLKEKPVRMPVNRIC